ncbi:HNS binding protein [Citrobacter phage Citrof5]
MAFTKKFKVSFDMTVKVDSKTEQLIKERIRELAKQVGSGEKVSATDRELLVRALTYGPDGAVAFCAKHGVRSAIKELGKDHQGEGLVFSPATVRVVC